MPSDALKEVRKLPLSERGAKIEALSRFIIYTNKDLTDAERLEIRQRIADKFL